MILITSAKYSSADFTLEFGKIPPSFLPLGQKRLYEYQIALFKGQKVCLSLPKGFKLNSYDKKKLESLGVSLLFVPENLGLGESVVYCINLLSLLNEELYILHGDTFFGELEFVPNSLQVTPVRENYDWAYLDDGFCTTKDSSKQALILAGAYHISHPHVLVRSIVECGYSYVLGLKLYSKSHPFCVIENHTWLDFGLITSYFHSKKAISTSRAFNSLQIEKGYVFKQSKWQKKIQAELAWFLALPKELWLYVPKVLPTKEGYCVEYLYHNTLSELFVFGSLPQFVWKRIFLSLREFLELLHGFKSNETPCFSYIEKTQKRLLDFSAQSGIDLKKEWVLNGKNQGSILELFEKLRPFLAKPAHFSLIHGDFCFSNIMYDFRANTIKAFDPRGLDFDGKITAFGDGGYDLAKLVHSVFGLYDLIISGFFECDYEGYEIEFLIEEEELLPIQESFLEVFSLDWPKKALSISLFLSMLPLHGDCQKRQMAFLANAFRLYEKFFEQMA